VPRLRGRADARQSSRGPRGNFLSRPDTQISHADTSPYTCLADILSGDRCFRKFGTLLSILFLPNTFWDVKMSKTAPVMDPEPQHQQPLYPSRRSVVHSINGMVACTQPLAAEAGHRILRQGGNAAVGLRHFALKTRGRLTKSNRMLQLLLVRYLKLLNCHAADNLS
jgi:hypothetical protein